MFNKKKVISILGIIIVAIILVVSFLPFNELYHPSFIVKNSDSTVYLSGNLTNRSSLNPLMANSTSSNTLIIGSGNESSSLILNTSTIGLFDYAHAIILVFTFNLAASIETNLGNPSLIWSFSSVISNLTNTEKMNAFDLGFMGYIKSDNTSAGSAFKFNNASTFMELPINLLNKPKWTIFGGYSEQFYRFSFGANVNFEFIPYVGLHIFNFTMNMKISGKPVTSSIDFVINNE